MMIKPSKVKNIAPYLVLVGTISGAFGWLYSHFTPMTAHAQLEQRVTANELALLREKILSEIYFLRAQLRKYPNDQSIADQLDRAMKQLEEVEQKIPKL